MRTPKIGLTQLIRFQVKALSRGICLSFMYTRKGLVTYVLFCSFFCGVFATGLYARSENPTVATVLAVFFSWFLFVALCSTAIGICMMKITTDIWAQDVLNAPKKLVINPSQTVLEAEHHNLTEVNLEEIHNLLEFTRINLGLNQLKTIDLSPLTGSSVLKELILYMNYLESIDLSPLASCPNFEYLDLTDNNLETIDLTPLASCLKLNALNIGINRTSEIDLSPLAECKDLKILTIDGMNLREIDLSPLKNCTKLEFLKLDDNELISLDVTPLFDCKSLIDFPIDKIELTTTLSREVEDWPEGVRKHTKKFRKR
jgi:hypothetical protein